MLDGHRVVDLDGGVGHVGQQVEGAFVGQQGLLYDRGQADRWRRGILCLGVG